MPNDRAIDRVKEARDFYRLILGVNVSEVEMKRIIYR
jgi:hypothetical protein